MAETIMVVVAPKRGPRTKWRCKARNANGHRCHFPLPHEGDHSAFGAAF